MKRIEKYATPELIFDEFGIEMDAGERSFFAAVCAYEPFCFYVIDAADGTRCIVTADELNGDVLDECTFDEFVQRSFEYCAAELNRGRN